MASSVVELPWAEWLRASPKYYPAWMMKLEQWEVTWGPDMLELLEIEAQKRMKFLYTGDKARLYLCNWIPLDHEMFNMDFDLFGRLLTKRFQDSGYRYIPTLFFIMVIKTQTARHGRPALLNRWRYVDSVESIRKLVIAFRKRYEKEGWSPGEWRTGIKKYMERVLPSLDNKTNKLVLFGGNAGHAYAVFIELKDELKGKTIHVSHFNPVPTEETQTHLLELYVTGVVSMCLNAGKLRRLAVDLINRPNQKVDTNFDQIEGRISHHKCGCDTTARFWCQNFPSECGPLACLTIAYHLRNNYSPASQTCNNRCGDFGSWAAQINGRAILFHFMETGDFPDEKDAARLSSHDLYNSITSSRVKILFIELQDLMRSWGINNMFKNKETEAIIEVMGSQSQLTIKDVWIHIIERILTGRLFGGVIEDGFVLDIALFLFMVGKRGTKNLRKLVDGITPDAKTIRVVPCEVYQTESTIPSSSGLRKTPPHSEDPKELNLILGSFIVEEQLVVMFRHPVWIDLYTTEQNILVLTTSNFPPETLNLLIPIFKARYAPQTRDHQTITMNLQHHRRMTIQQANNFAVLFCTSRIPQSFWLTYLCRGKVGRAKVNQRFQLQTQYFQDVPNFNPNFLIGNIQVALLNLLHVDTHPEEEEERKHKHKRWTDLITFVEDRLALQENEDPVGEEEMEEEVIVPHQSSAVNNQPIRRVLRNRTESISSLPLHKFTKNQNIIVNQLGMSELFELFEPLKDLCSPHKNIDWSTIRKSLLLYDQNDKETVHSFKRRRAKMKSLLQLPTKDDYEAGVASLYAQRDGGELPMLMSDNLHVPKEETLKKIITAIKNRIGDVSGDCCKETCFNPGNQTWECERRICPCMQDIEGLRCECRHLGDCHNNHLKKGKFPVLGVHSHRIKLPEPEDREIITPGITAFEVIAKNQLVTVFSGTCIQKKKVWDASVYSAQAIKEFKLIVIDPVPTGNAGGLINDPGPALEPNVDIIAVYSNGEYRLCLVALVDIGYGEPLRFYYGDEYWKGRIRGWLIQNLQWASKKLGTLQTNIQDLSCYHVTAIDPTTETENEVGFRNEDLKSCYLVVFHILFKSPSFRHFIFMGKNAGSKLIQETRRIINLLKTARGPISVRPFKKLLMIEAEKRMADFTDKEQDTAEMIGYYFSAICEEVDFVARANHTLMSIEKERDFILNTDILSKMVITKKCTGCKHSWKEYSPQSFQHTITLPNLPLVDLESLFKSESFQNTSHTTPCDLCSNAKFIEVKEDYEVGGIIKFEVPRYVRNPNGRFVQNPTKLIFPFCTKFNDEDYVLLGVEVNDQSLSHTLAFEYDMYSDVPVWKKLDSHHITQVTPEEVAECDLARGFTYIRADVKNEKWTNHAPSHMTRPLQKQTIEGSHTFPSKMNPLHIQSIFNHHQLTNLSIWFKKNSKPKRIWTMDWITGKWVKGRELWFSRKTSALSIVWNSLDGLIHLTIKEFISHEDPPQKKIFPFSMFQNLEGIGFAGIDWKDPTSKNNIQVLSKAAHRAIEATILKMYTVLALEPSLQDNVLQLASSLFRGMSPILVSPTAASQRATGNQTPTSTPVRIYSPNNATPRRNHVQLPIPGQLFSSPLMNDSIRNLPWESNHALELSVIQSPRQVPDPPPSSPQVHLDSVHLTPEQKRLLLTCPTPEEEDEEDVIDPDLLQEVLGYLSNLHPIPLDPEDVLSKEVDLDWEMKMKISALQQMMQRPERRLEVLQYLELHDHLDQKPWFLSFMRCIKIGEPMRTQLADVSPCDYNRLLYILLNHANVYGDLIQRGTLSRYLVLETADGIPEFEILDRDIFTQRMDRLLQRDYDPIQIRALSSIFDALDPNNATIQMIREKFQSLWIQDVEDPIPMAVDEPDLQTLVDTFVLPEPIAIAFQGCDRGLKTGELQIIKDFLEIWKRQPFLLPTSTSEIKNVNTYRGWPNRTDRQSWMDVMTELKNKMSYYGNRKQIFKVLQTREHLSQYGTNFQTFINLHAVSNKGALKFNASYDYNGLVLVVLRSLAFYWGFFNKTLTELGKPPGSNLKDERKYAMKRALEANATTHLLEVTDWAIIPSDVLKDRLKRMFEKILLDEVGMYMDKALKIADPEGRDPVIRAVREKFTEWWPRIESYEPIVQSPEPDIEPSPQKPNPPQKKGKKRRKKFV